MWENHGRNACAAFYLHSLPALSQAFQSPLCPAIGCDERAKAKTKTAPAICGKRRTVMHACTAQGNKNHQKYNNLQQVRSTGRYMPGETNTTCMYGRAGRLPHPCQAGSGIWPQTHMQERVAPTGRYVPARQATRPTCTADLGTSQPMCRVANGLMTSLLTTESYCA